MDEKNGSDEEESDGDGHDKSESKEEDEEDVDEEEAEEDEVAETKKDAGAHEKKTRRVVHGEVEVELLKIEGLKPGELVMLRLN